MASLNGVTTKSVDSGKPVVNNSVKNSVIHPGEKKTNSGLGIDFATLMVLNLIHEYAGFRATEQLEEKIKHTFRNSDSDELKEWISHMEKDPSKSDLNALVEDLANKETYFFRDKNQLEAYSEFLLPTLIKNKLSKVQNRISIWSAGCSSGEEAYTLAMLLCEKLIDAKIAFRGVSNEVFFPSAWDISILGTDISRQAIRMANDGSYKKGGFDSFRQFPEDYLNYFETEAHDNHQCDESHSNDLQINNSLGQIVSFEQQNLLDDCELKQKFDIVFCRNVLINIDPDRHKEIVLMMHDSLRDGGVLILSPVDIMPVEGLFDEVWENKCMVYEKKS